MARLAPEEIPQDARELAELFASRLDFVTGKLHLIYVDGRYVDGYREERMSPTSLAEVSIGGTDDAQQPAEPRRLDPETP